MSYRRGFCDAEDCPNPPERFSNGKRTRWCPEHRAAHGRFLMGQLAAISKPSNPTTALTPEAGS